MIEYPFQRKVVENVLNGFNLRKTWTAKKKGEQSQTCSLEQRFDQCSFRGQYDPKPE